MFGHVKVVDGVDAHGAEGVSAVAVVMHVTAGDDGHVEGLVTVDGKGEAEARVAAGDEDDLITVGGDAGGGELVVEVVGAYGGDAGRAQDVLVPVHGVFVLDYSV